MKKKEIVQWCMIFVIVIATAILLLVREKGEEKEETRWITRPETGTRYETIFVTVGDVTKEWELPISSRERTFEETEAAFAETIQNIYRMLGVEEGETATLTESLTLPRYDDETGVNIRWSTSEASVVSKDGTVQREQLKESCEVILQACLSFEGESKEHWFYVRVLPYEAESTEALLYAAGESIKKLEKETRKEDGFYLPDTVGTVSVGTGDTSGALIKWVLAAALFLPLVIVIARRQEKEKERKKRDGDRMAEYPQLITKLTLYIGAGLGLRGAWERLAAEYRVREEATGKKSAVGDEVLLLTGELKNGTSESKAYEDFGRRIGLKPYLRCVSLMVSQLQKGSGALRKSLEGEVRLAWESYRERVTQKGEEAQTKLLFPMMGMLFLVMAIVMIPAFFAM